MALLVRLQELFELLIDLSLMVFQKVVQELVLQRVRDVLRGDVVAK